MKFEKFGALDSIVTGPENAEKTVVLLHGFGAPGTDLVGLGAELALPDHRLVFLMAPNLLEPGLPPEHSGRAWWHIDMMELQVLRMTGAFDVLADYAPEGLTEARTHLASALAGIRKAYSIERLVLGGFSQGAMLSCDYTLRSDDPAIAGLLVLSGTYLERKVWKPKMRDRSGLPCFQSHSPDDQVLPHGLAKILGADLDEAGVRRTWVEFRGGHGIGPTVLSGLREFLKGLPG